MRDERDVGISWQFLSTLNRGNGPVLKQRGDILSVDRPSMSSLGRLDVIKPHTVDRKGPTSFHKAGKASIHISVVVIFKCLECKQAGEVSAATYLYLMSWWTRFWTGVLLSCSCSVDLRATSCCWVLSTVCGSTQEAGDSKQSLNIHLSFVFYLLFYDNFLWYFIICLKETRGQRSNQSSEKVQGFFWQSSSPSDVQ